MLSVLVSQTHTFEEGVSYYNNRAENAKGLTAEDTNILKAIDIFESLKEAYSVSTDQDLQVGIYLTKSYYFLAQYIADSQEDKKLYFQLAKTLSNQYIHKYNDSVELIYWNLATISNWAKLVGVRRITKLGAADEYREKAVDVIVLDSQYEEGGGYFLLGAVYFTAPYIPLIISWPDNHKAVRYFRKAVETGRPTPLQMLYLAKALIKINDNNKAKDILIKIIDTTPNDSNYIEDSHYIHEAKNILNDNF